MPARTRLVLRATAMIALGLSAIAAGWLFLVASVYEAGLYENTNREAEPGEWVMVAAALAFVAACAAVAGLAIRSVRVARVSSAVQMLSALWVAWLLSSSGPVLQDALPFLPPFLVLDLLVFASADWLCRRSDTTPGR